MYYMPRSWALQATPFFPTSKGIYLTEEDCDNSSNRDQKHRAVEWTRTIQPGKDCRKSTALTKGCAVPLSERRELWREG